MLRTRLIAGLLLTATVLAACTSRDTGRPAPGEHQERSATPLPAREPAVNHPAALPPTAEAAPCPPPPVPHVSRRPAAGLPAVPPLLLREWSHCGPSDGFLRALDPATGRELDGYEPSALRYFAVGSISPDGRLLAAVTEGHLRVLSLDPAALEMEIEDLRALDIGGPLVWGPDSARLFAVSLVKGKPSWVVDVRQGAARRLAGIDFATDRPPLVSPDGRRLYLFGFDLADERAWIVSGDPFLAVMDAHTGAVLARVALPGVLVGQRREQDPDRVFNAIYRPPTALAPDGSRYYVVHADEDRVTVVDLRALRLEQTVKIAREPSAPGRLVRALSDVLARRVEAKGGLDVKKQAELSPDGRRLYGGGVEEGDRGGPPEARKPLGLKVIDTSTMRVTHQEDGIDRFVLSPDGRWLFGTGWGFAGYDATGHHRANVQGGGLKVLDARSPLLVAHVTPDAAYHQVAVSPDGRYLHLLSEGPGLGQAGSNQGRCAAPCWLLSVVELESSRVVAQGPVHAYSIEFLSLPRRR